MNDYDADDDDDDDDNDYDVDDYDCTSRQIFTFFNQLRSKYTFLAVCCVLIADM